MIYIVCQKQFVNEIYLRALIGQQKEVEIFLPGLFHSKIR